MFKSLIVHYLLQACTTISCEYSLESYELSNEEGLPCQESSTTDENKTRFVACDCNLHSGLAHGSDNTAIKVMSVKR